jgi:hypothetical protein
MTPAKYGTIDAILMMPDEIDFMTSLITADSEPMLMVEWGSGGSTCKWLEVLGDNQRLISIEHNAQWYEKVKDNVALHFGNLDFKFQYYLREDKTLWHYNRIYGHISEELPVGLENYICPDSDIFDADIFFIDGVARGACLSTVLLKKKPTARVFIHDYADRINWYSWITQFVTVEVVGTTLAEIKI